MSLVPHDRMSSRILGLLLLLTICCLPSMAVTPVSTGYARHGLIGYGINMYNPICASACQDAITKYLYCNDTTSDSDDGMSSMSMITMMDMGGTTNSTSNLTATMSPSLACIADNAPYLQTVAYCMSQRCDSTVSVAEREEWWGQNVVGSAKDQPAPSMSYQEALMSVTSAPTSEQNTSEPLTSVALIGDDVYIPYENICGNFQWQEKLHSMTSIILVVTCCAIPIAASLLRFLPWPAKLVSLFHATIIDRPLLGRHVTAPLVGRLLSQPRGNAIFHLYIVGINIILCAVGFRSVQPNAWWSTRSAEIFVYIANRAGAVSFANIAVLILYAGRNNVLLWLTDWPYPTFLGLHKTVAWVATIEACLHSAMYLQEYQSAGTLYTESAVPYWIAGIVATLAMSILLVVSVRPLRQAAYELFLVVHILLSILVIWGCWAHIVWRYDRQWGYENWIIIAAVFWGFDRALRMVRCLFSGVKRATVYRIDNDYLRVDIPGVHCSGYAFVYFPSLLWRPTLTNRPWENHPFSVIDLAGPPPMLSASTDPSTPSFERKYSEGTETDAQLSTAINDPHSDHQELKAEQELVQSGTRQESQGVTLLVRVQKGVTRELDRLVSEMDAGKPLSLPVLVEGSYGYPVTTITRDWKLGFSAWTSDFPHLVCIAGGVGITACLPAILGGAGRGGSRRVSLYWSARSAKLVEAVEDIVRAHTPRPGQSAGASGWADADVDVQIVVGERLDLPTIIQHECSTSAEAGSGMLVFVCRPPAMNRTVRELVASHGRGGSRVMFAEESFDW